MKDGRIIARKVTSYADSGAYNRHTPYARDQARGQHRRPVHDPERVDRRLLRLYQPPADQRHARLRRDDGVLRDRGADGQDRPHGRHGPVEIRLLNAYRNGDMKPHQKVVEDATLVEAMQAAAEMVGHDAAAPSSGR